MEVAAVSEIRKGDTVRWRRDVSKDATPMVVYERHGAAVRIDGPAGSLVAVNLLELVDAAPHDDAEMAKVIEAQAGAIDTGFKILDQMIAPPADDGLMAVIEAQMQGLDDLAAQLAEERSLRAGEVAMLEGKLSEYGDIVIRSPRFMDPPDGGGTTLAEQIDRMQDAIDAAEAERNEEIGLRRVAENDLAAAEAYKAGSDEGFREEVERMLGNVCIALGFPREPLQKTGIPELDALVRYVATA